MHYKIRCSFQGSRNSSTYFELTHLLEDIYHLKTNINPGNDITPTFLITFNIEETAPQYNEIMQAIDSDLWRNRGVNCGKLYFPVYTKEELDSAQWLRISCSFSPLINPYYETPFVKKCFAYKNKHDTDLYRHYYECEEYAFTAPVKWKKRSFASIRWLYQYLYCSDRTRKILEDNGIRGIVYSPAYKGATKNIIPDLHHLTPTFRVPGDALVGIDAFVDYTCPNCGMKMLKPTGGRFRYGVRAGSIPNDIDFCQTDAAITHNHDGETTNGRCYPLISQRMYRVIKENKMDASLTITPVEIIP